MAATVTVQIPDLIYQLLVNTANATGRALEEVMLYALKVGSQPDWDKLDRGSRSLQVQGQQLRVASDHEPPLLTIVDVSD